VLGAVWAGAQVAYAVAGIGFDTSTRLNFWQFVDPGVLHDAPLKSLWYLHSQPPLFNAFLWFAESVSPFGLGPTAQVTYLVLGLALTVASALLARELGVPWTGAVVIGAVIGCNPVTILYQNYLYPTLPVAALLVLTALALARFERSSRLAWLVCFFVGCAMLVLLRSVFHPVWFALVVVLAAWWATRRVGFARVAAACAIPVIAVAGLSLKNFLLFGDPGTSTWLGMSLAKLTTYPLPRDELEELVRDGKADRLVFATPFFPFATYEAEGAEPSAPRGVEAFDAPLKRNGERNLNYGAYIDISRRSLHNDLAAIRAHPHEYLDRVGEAWNLYLGSPSSFMTLDANREKIELADSIWRVVAYGERPESLDLPSQTVNGASIGIVTVAIMATLGIGAVVAMIGRPRWLRNLARRPTMIFGLSTCLGFALVANATELGENMRFRYELEPLQIILAVALWLALARRLRRRRTIAADVRLESSTSSVDATRPVPRSPQPSTSSGSTRATPARATRLLLS
jgi:hypothetical protein